MRAVDITRAGLSGGSFEDSPEFWQRAYRRPVSLDPDEATAEVVAFMASMARSSAGEPEFRRNAQAAVDQFRGGPLWAGAGFDPFRSTPLHISAAIAESCWWWAKQYIRFEHHSSLIWRRLGEVDQWQLLISPDVLVRQRPMKGDCAIFSTCIAAMLEAWGVGWEYITSASDRRNPAVYSHVWPRAILADGSRLSLDASHGAYPGWQVPAYDIFRLQAWDRFGRPVADRAAKFRGLHGL